MAYLSTEKQVLRRKVKLQLQTIETIPYQSLEFRELILYHFPQKNSFSIWNQIHAIRFSTYSCFASETLNNTVRNS